MALRQSSGVPQCNKVTRMHLATIELLCKQTTDNFRTRPPTELIMAQSISYYLFLIIHVMTYLSAKEDLSIEHSQG